MWLKKSAWKDVKVTVIVSTGRTGTKFFGTLFSDLTKFCAVHEPSPIGNFEGAEFIKGNLQEKQLIDFLLKSRKPILKKISKSKISNYLESNGGLIYYSNILHEVFPNIRIAHLVRNPKDFVRSGCSRLSENAEHLKYEDDSTWLLKSSEVQGNDFYDKWGGMDMAERFMWTWNFKNTFVHQQSLKHNHIKTFKFEDVISDEIKKNDFYKFLSHDADYITSEFIKKEGNIETNKTDKFQFPEYENWSSAHKEKLKMHCGNLMGIYGYEVL